MWPIVAGILKAIGTAALGQISKDVVGKNGSSPIAALLKQGVSKTAGAIGNAVGIKEAEAAPTENTDATTTGGDTPQPQILEDIKMPTGGGMPSGEYDNLPGMVGEALSSRKSALDKVAELTGPDKKGITGNHPVGAFLDALFSHDRPSMELGQEGFGSSVGATLGNMMRENAFRLKSDESSPVSVAKAISQNPTSMSDINQSFIDSDLRGTIAPTNNMNLTLGQKENTSLENYRIKNEMVRQSLLPAIGTKYMGRDQVRGETILAQSPEELKAYYITKYPGVFTPGDPDFEKAVSEAFAKDNTEQPKKKSLFGSKKSGNKNTRAVEIFLENEPNKEEAMEYLKSLED